jgi:SAM-dependent methyltransferase
MGGFLKALYSENLSGKIVLDLGCGYGLWGHVIRATVGNGGNDCFLVGADIWKPYLAETQRHKAYDSFVVCDVRFLPFRKGAAEFVVAFEVLEHLTRNEGFAFLENLKELSRRVLISTPCNFYEQSEIRGNRFERHQSGWREKDFMQHKFKAYKTGLGGDLEVVARKLHMLDFFHRLMRGVYRNEWSGAMIIAEYASLEHEDFTLYYTEKV